MRLLLCSWSADIGIALVDRDEAELRSATDELGAGEAIIVDVSEYDAVTSMVDQTIKVFGQIDAPVNNAGVAYFGPMVETEFARWRHVMATNLDGIFLCSQAVLPWLKQSRGCIVNIASISGFAGLNAPGCLRNIESCRYPPHQTAGC